MTSTSKTEGVPGGSGWSGRSGRSGRSGATFSPIDKLDIPASLEGREEGTVGPSSPPLVTPNGMTRFLPWKRAELASSSHSRNGNDEMDGNYGDSKTSAKHSAMAFVKKAYGVGSDYGVSAKMNLKKMLPQNRKDLRDQTKIRHTYSLSRQGSMNSYSLEQDSLSFHSTQSSMDLDGYQQGRHATVGGEAEDEVDAKVERTVLFNDGSSYSGEWLGKHIEGRGVFMWANGDRFEGEWKNDVQHGQGTYAAADGSMYYGGWKDGMKDGEGVYRPSATNKDGSEAEPRLYLRRYEDGVLVKETVLDLAKEAKGRLKHKQEKHRQKHEAGRKKREELQRPLKPGEVIYKGHHSYDLMRQLQLGIMYGIAQEETSDAAVRAVGAAVEENADATNDTLTASALTSATKRESPEKASKSAKLNDQCSTTELSKKDYNAVVVQNFPSSNTLPAFEYKEYVPKLFKLLRQSFGVDSADYLVSITGGPALREMPSPGASGCIFFLSEDDRFFIKSVRKDEMGIVLQFMKYYQRYVCRNPMTLLVKFFGIHRVSPWFGKNARFVVMGNVLPTEKRMHRKYDLKGSTYKRTVGKERLKDPTATLKDLDIDMKFLISSRNYLKVLATMQNDVNFLAERNLIDYSLLLGVHVIAWGEQQWYPPGDVFQNGLLDSRATVRGDASGHDDEQHGLPAGGTVVGTSLRSLEQKKYHSLALSRNLVQNVDSLDLLEAAEGDMVKSAASLIASANSVRDAARTSAASASSFMEFSQNSATWQGSMSMIKDRGDRGSSVVGSSGHGEETSIGWAMPAIAVQTCSDGVEHKTPVLLYFGIIDFLQKYNTRKKMEKMWKTTLHGPSVSVADPKKYADRFMRFMKGVFVDIGDQFGHVEGMEYV